ncbi:uncharacterized protein [Argopecten irradians]|uniref:uncharacterized protein n=1 Tax=Argopecten irradians TaxID=31199 RepID=UPI003711D6FE
MVNLHFLVLFLPALIWHTAAVKTVVTEEVKCEEREVDIAFIIDGSGSIGSEDFNLIRQFLIKFLDYNAINTGSVKVAVVSFSSYAQVEFYFNTYDNKEDIQRVINDMPYMGYATNLTGGLKVTREDVFNYENGDRKDVSDMAVLITDGEPNIEKGAQLRKELAKWKGSDSKNIPLLAIGIGKDFEEEKNKALLRSIAESEDMINIIESYKEMDRIRGEIFKKICKVIQRISTVKDGDPCFEEGQEINSKCKRFVCQGGHWFRTWKGCMYNGCMDWDSVKMDGCNRYKCVRKSECFDSERNFCMDYDVELVSVGCMDKGECREEDSTWNNDKTCETFQCKRGVDQESKKPLGVIEKIDEKCMDPEGVCRNEGYKYSEHCTGFKCQRVEQVDEPSVLKFVTYEAGCKHEGKCIPLGDVIKEGCNELVCTYDDSTQLYDFVLDTIQCEHEGECYEIDSQWNNGDNCTKFKCIYNEKLKKTAVRERVAGCKTEYGCVKKGENAGRGKCIDYTCGSNGDMELVKAGCPVNDECKPLKSSWRVPGVCAQFYCREGEDEDGYITTVKDKDVECHDFQGNCIKVGTTTMDNCQTYTCGPNGKLNRTDAGCKYKGKCYAIGDKWEDRDKCKEFRCKADETEGAVYFGLKNGCVDFDGVCYKPGEVRKIPYTCLTEVCGTDHVLRANLCQYKDDCYEIGQNWTDVDDCLTFYCKEDPDSATAVMEEEPFGCLMDYKCYAPGKVIKKGCETLECMSDGRGFHPIDEECPWNGECKAVGTTWFDKDECAKYGCVQTEDGVSIEEIIEGCRDDYRERCFRNGATVGMADTCIRFQCQNGKMIPIAVGCPHEGRCLNVSEVVKDEKTCIRYECAVEEEGEGFIKTVKKERAGCLDHDTCYWRGQTKTEACVTYRCMKGGFKVVDAQCEFRGHCKFLNSKWEHEKKCLTFSCVKKGDAEIPKVKRDLWGCRDEKGKCYTFGKTKKINNCVTFVCERRKGYGAQFFPKDVGCEFRRKCKAVDEEWVHRRKCVKQTCLYTEGSDLPEVMSSPYGCRSGDKCYAFGELVTDDENACVKYECTKYEIFSPVETGCMYNGQCKKDRSRWVDREKCIRYKCKSESVSPSQVIMHTKKEKGCKDFDGKCMWPGDTTIKDCTTYLCDPTKGTLVIIKEDCQDGDQCRALNSEWFDSETCTDYKCMYSPVLNDIIIDAKTTGCKNDDGRCFQKGEKKEEGCNKFLCNKNSNFRPVEMGCQWRKKCYKIGETWQKNCITYTCELVAKGPNFVETHVNESHGCLCGSGGCYRPGDKRTDGCLTYVCREGGEFELARFACTIPDGCLKPGEFYMDENECVEYTCSRKTRSLEPVNRRCKWKGQCKERDSKWFDKDACQGYKCAYSPADNDVKVVERTAGCRDDEGQCKRSGATVPSTNECVKFRCENGELVPEKVGCEWGDECVPRGYSWLEDCVQYSCQIEEQGPTYIDTTVVAHHGCHDCTGKCYMPGEEITQGCLTRECTWGGYFKNVKVGCMTKSGECVEIGEKINYGVREQVCGDDGDLVPVEPPTGCYDGDNKFYPIGEYMTKDCEKFECQRRGYTANFYLVQKGCMYKNKCRDVGFSWSDFATCRFFYCTNQQSGVGVLEAVIKELDGCWDSRNEKCRENEETWYEGCFQKQCIVTKSKKNSVMKNVVIVSGGCEQKIGKKTICHAPGEIWSEDREDMCQQMQCQVKKNVYTSKPLKPLCRDLDGNCRDVGDVGFDAKVNGEVLRNCKCKIRNKQLNYVCKGY